MAFCVQQKKALYWVEWLFGLEWALVLVIVFAWWKSRMSCCCTVGFLSCHGCVVLCRPSWPLEHSSTCCCGKTSHTAGETRCNWLLNSCGRSSSSSSSLLSGNHTHHINRANVIFPTRPFLQQARWHGFRASSAMSTIPVFITPRQERHPGEWTTLKTPYYLDFQSISELSWQSVVTGQFSPAYRTCPRQSRDLEKDQKLGQICQ